MKRLDTRHFERSFNCSRLIFAVDRSRSRRNYSDDNKLSFILVIEIIIINIVDNSTKTPKRRVLEVKDEIKVSSRDGHRCSCT